MDPVELTDLPPQACQHPFVHNHEGFQVRVTRKGSKQQAYSRMVVIELDQHLAAAASASGHAEDDSAFYAAQLVHYGLPSDLHRERAMRTLRELITRKGGRPSIPVPTTIRRIENKLKKQYESLMAKERVLQALSAKATELEGELAVERQTLADLQRRVQEVNEIIRNKEETLEQKKREMSDLQNDRHFANADPPKHEGLSGGEEAEQDSEESESDIPVNPLKKRKAFIAEDHLPDTCRGYKSQRLLTPPLTRTGARESYGAAVTRHEMPIDATERTYNAREDVTLRKQGPTERGREYALYPNRWESNVRPLEFVPGGMHS